MQEKPKFIYSLEIATTPQKLWRALTSSEFWEKFSGPVESDWKTGSPVRYFLPDRKLYSEGVVIESNPPRLLRHTWPDPEGDKTKEAAARLTWQITPLDPGKVKLTMIHENLTQKAYEGVSGGWPLLLHELKTRLEIKLS